MRVHLRGELKALQRSLGVTMVMVTHDQEEALSIADRVVVMNRGMVEQIGSPEEIYNQPSSTFVADFIGAMSFFDGVAESGGGVRLANVHLHCDPGGHAEGELVTVAIRPEDVMVQDVSLDSENAFEVQVGPLEFLGSYVRTKLEHPAFNDHPLTAEFSQNLVRRLNVECGSKLPIRLPPERLRVFRRSEDNG